MKDKVKDKGRRSFSEKNNLQFMFPIFGLQHNEILERERKSLSDKRNASPLI